MQLKKSEIEKLITLFKNNQIKKREYEALRYRPRKSPRNTLLLSNGNQSDEKKENKLLRPILGIFALGSTGFLLARAKSANPFFSITKKLVAPDPVSICMTVEDPRLEVPQLGIFGIDTVKGFLRAHSEPLFGRENSSPIEPLRALPNPERLVGRDVHYFTTSEDSPTPSVKEAGN